MNAALKDLKNRELLAEFAALLPDADVFMNSYK
jgi:hypothetical protein